MMGATGDPEIRADLASPLKPGHGAGEAQTPGCSQVKTSDPAPPPRAGLGLPSSGFSHTLGPTWCRVGTGAHWSKCSVCLRTERAGHREERSAALQLHKQLSGAGLHMPAAEACPHTCVCTLARTPRAQTHTGSHLHKGTHRSQSPTRRQHALTRTRCQPRVSSTTTHLLARSLKGLGRGGWGRKAQERHTSPVTTGAGPASSFLAFWSLPTWTQVPLVSPLPTPGGPGAHTTSQGFS